MISFSITESASRSPETENVSKPSELRYASSVRMMEISSSTIRIFDMVNHLLASSIKSATFTV